MITLQREEIKLREAGENAWKSGKKVKICTLACDWSTGLELTNHRPCYTTKNRRDKYVYLSSIPLSISSIELDLALISNDSSILTMDYCRILALWTRWRL